MERVIPAIIAVTIPIIFLYAVRRLDLYASGGFKPVLWSLGWGIVSFFIALQINSALLPVVGYWWLPRYVAPVVEEILKSIILLYYLRHPDFKYFVDESIYGFAAGVGFAVCENLFYLSNAPANIGLGLAASRAFSTALMHGSASALVGLALGRLRFGRGWRRGLALGAGWGAAMVLHILFNNLVNSTWGEVVLWLAIALGVLGVALNGAFVWLGMLEDKQAIHDALNLNAGVSGREVALVDQVREWDKLLAPITERFGAEKRQQAETFLRLETQIGLKRKAQRQTDNESARAKLTTEIETMQADLNKMRRTLGVYCMTYVRTIMPPTTAPLWELLATDSAAPRETLEKDSLWNNLSEKLK